MAKYRKKPIEIEAFKWTGDINQTEDPIWIVEAIKKGDAWVHEDSINGAIEMRIKTLEGVMTANKGDYIIKGIKGEIYPCKSEIFEMAYEAAEKNELVEKRKECVSENNEKINTVIIMCDGEEIIIRVLEDIEDVSKALHNSIEAGLEIVMVEDYYSKRKIFFNPKKVSSIKYFEKWN